MNNKKKAETFARNIVADANDRMNDIIDSTNEEVLRQLDQLRLEDDPDYNPHWREDTTPTLRDKARAKWAMLKRGLTSEEAQEFALMVGYLGSCYAAGWAINKAVAYVYNKTQEARNG